MSGFAEMLRFELALQLRRPSTWFFALLMVVLGVLFTISLGSDMGTNVNAPGSLTLYTLVLGFFGILVTAALFGDAAHRDVEWRMQPLFHSMPLEKRQYLAGRYLGAWIVNALVLLAAPVGLIVGTFMPSHNASVGPLVLGDYLRPYLYFLVPGLFVNSAILFGMAALSRRALPAYLGAVGLFGAYSAAIAVTSELMTRQLGAVIDPSGIVALLELMLDWSPVERNTQPIRLAGTLLVNRLLWTGVGAGVLTLTYARFRFGHHEGAERAPRTAGEGPADERLGVTRRVSADGLHHAPQPQAFGAHARWRQALAVAHRSVQEIFSSRDFKAVMVATVLLAIGLGWEMAGDRFGTPVWPVTSVVGRFLASGIFGMAFALITAFYAGELVWRERDAGVADIADAAPVPDWVPFAGKLMALTLLLLVLQAVLMLSGMLLQALRGYFRFEPLLYLQMLFGLKFVDYVLFAVIAMLIHSLVNQKYIGHLVAVLFALMTWFARFFGIHHRLVVYGSDPGWVHSDLSGFGPYLAGYVWVKLYWVAWAFLLGVLATLAWVRGRELGAGRRMRLARQRVTRRTAGALAGAVLLIVGTGGFVFYNTNVLNEYRTAEEQAAVQAEYERRYKRLERTVQPKMARVQLRAELYPEQRRVEVTGLYVLANRSPAPIDSIVVYLRPFYSLQALRVDRPSRQVLADTVRRVWIQALGEPLLPGDSLQLHFALTFEPRGFRNDGVENAVVENGTYVRKDVMPDIGYQRESELSNPVTRERLGLAPRELVPPPTDSAARMTGPVLVQFDAIVGTAGDQIPSAPGTLRRTWTENGRRYAEFTSVSPMSGRFSFLSGRYAVRESSRGGMKVQVLHHPGHHWNADRILTAAERSLDYYVKHFGPNAFGEMRIVEFPRYAVLATASPNLIAHSESFGFLSRVRDDDLDTPLLVTAHELAHQWWGGQILPATALGGQVLTETLANYSAMMVLAQVQGAPAVRRFQRLMHIEYLNRRGRGDRPLLLTGDIDNVHYRKGALVMYALRELWGEARVNAALRELVRKHRFATAPYTTSLDLHRELAAVAPDSLRYLLTDLMETMTIWDLRTADARSEPLGAGRHRVTMEIAAGKFRVDSAGTHTEVPMNDLVEVAVFGGGDDAESTPLYLGKHWVKSGRQTITVVVNGEAAVAGVDPWAVLVARRGDDLADRRREVKGGR